jgi:hypothetical protein
MSFRHPPLSSPPGSATREPVRHPIRDRLPQTVDLPDRHDRDTILAVISRLLPFSGSASNCTVYLSPVRATNDAGAGSWSDPSAADADAHQCRPNPMRSDPMAQDLSRQRGGFRVVFHASAAASNIARRSLSVDGSAQ